MKKRFAIFIILACITTLCQATKIGDLQYKLSSKDQTAIVTYDKFNTTLNYANLTYIIIPTVVTHKGVTYRVTEIGDYAFNNCRNLTAVFIHADIKRIGEHVFEGCKGLTVYSETSARVNVNPPASMYQYNAQMISLVTKDRVVYNKPVEYDYTVVSVPQGQLMYYYPFSAFAKVYVEKGINDWQKKGEFERTSDWQQRVNEQTRQQQIQTLITDAEEKYIAFHANNIVIDPTLGKYDADNEVFAMNDEQFGTMYMPVPLNEAKDFKDQWSLKRATPHMQVFNDEIKLSALTFEMPNGKQYTYRNTDAVNYNLAEMEYNFDPIELDIPSNSAPQPGQHNITTTKVTIGKSEVDTNIPSSSSKNPNTFAIIFANEDYKNVASVPFAKNDGVIFQKYCQKTLGIPTTNIRYIENASYNDIRIQLAWLKDVCDAFEGKASIIVYYAGHGIPDETDHSAYLLPIDGDSRYVQSAYKIDEFYQKLGALNAKSVTVFMDACFSGSKREDGMLASARGVALKAKSGVPQGNMVVFSAAQGDETAYPNNEQQHGLFTYYLLKKLQETEGNVGLKELGDYVTKQVSQQSLLLNSKKQTPCVIPSAAVGTDWENWKLK